MLEKIIGFSINNKLIVFFFVITIVGFGLFSLTNEEWFEVQDSAGILHRADDNILIKGVYYLPQEY